MEVVAEAPQQPMIDDGEMIDDRDLPEDREDLGMEQYFAKACLASSDLCTIAIDMDDMDLLSFTTDAEAFLVEKLRAAEVSFGKLAPADRMLSMEAKARELSEFAGQEAVRRCQSEAEELEAWTTGRLIKARWVLTWKAIAPRSRRLPGSDELLSYLTPP